MPIKQKIEYYKDGKLITPNSSGFVGIDEWVKTLSESEQAEFNTAVSRQLASRQTSIDNGNMTLNDGQLWNTESIEDVNNIRHDQDEVWLSYYERWLSETGVTVNETYSTI